MMPKGAVTFTGLAQLLAEPDDAIHYLVADRIACGSVNMLAGKPKAGKSTAARALALAVACGGTWLGCACVACLVWYLALEDKRSEVRRHFRNMGATGEEPIRFVFTADAHLLDDLQKLAAQEKPGLIVVDTLQRLIRAEDLNNYAEVTSKLTPLLAIARETGAAVLLVHHAGKSDRIGLDSVLGSTALTGSVDNVFLLARTERYRVLTSVQRIGPDLPETVITMTDSGKVQAGPSRHDADVNVLEGALVAAVRAAGSLTRTELLDQIEARRQLKLEALRRATAAGTFIRSGVGSKTDPHRFSLPVSSNSGSRVPSYSREPESSSSGFQSSSPGSGSDCGSHVPMVPQVPSQSRAEHSQHELDDVDVCCPVCGRESCEDDLASCLRNHVDVFRDLEDVFGSLRNVSVAQLQ